MGQQATEITAPIATVELLTYIGDPVSAYTTGQTEYLIPHSFLKVTDVNGNVSFVGFAPETTGLVGVGEIFNNADHRVFNSSGPITLSAEQGTRLMEYVNGSIVTPPYYNLPEGSQCAVWALNGVLKAMTGETIPTGASVPDPLGQIITTLINPYTTAILNNDIQAAQFAKEVGVAAVTAVADGIDGLNNLGSWIGQTLPTPTDISTYTAQQIEAGQSFLAGVSDAAKSAYDAASGSVTNAIADSYQQTLAATTSYAQSLVDAYGTSVGQTAESAAAFYDGMTNWAADRFGDVAQLYSVTDDVISGFRGDISNEYNRITNSISQDFDAVQSFIGDMLAGIADMANGGWGGFGGAGADGDSGGAGGAGSGASFGSTFSGVVDSIQGHFHDGESANSPLILDIDGDGVETIGKSAGIHFDLDCNGFAEQTGWVGKDDGLLVWDRNGNGKIDDGSELFGNNTVLANGQKAANGFAALAELDSNGDGRVDANDIDFSQLRVWKDGDSNAQVGSAEFLTLAQAGVQSMAVDYTQQGQTDAHGNQHLQAGQFIGTDGLNHAMDDVWFAIDTARTVDLNRVAESEAIAALPDIAGFGNVHSLHQAMARDSSGHLQNLVQQFAAESDPEARQEILTTLIYAWAGVENIDPASRNCWNLIGDARKLASLEVFLGEAYLGAPCVRIVVASLK